MRRREGWAGAGVLALIRLLVLLVAIWVVPADAQGRRDMGRTTRDVPPLAADEAEEFLRAFLTARGGMDSIFDARLIHYPRRGSKVELPVRIYSGWQGSVLRLRIEVDVDERGDAAMVRFLFQGGSKPAGWSWTPDSAVTVVPMEELFQPLLTGFDLTAFDLTAPYLDWPNANYDGSDRVADSPAHWFRFAPPEEWKQILETASVATIRVALDARFDAPVRVEYLNFSDTVVRSLEVRSFKKVDDTWFVRRLEGFDERSRNRTELYIDHADVEVQLSPQVFAPAYLGDVLPYDF